MKASLLVETRGPVLVMTLNRPERRNAIDDELASSLLSELGRLEADSGLRVGVLTGSGFGFSSGMDLREFQAKGTVDALRDILTISMSKPLIAAVEGFAVAGGFEIALRCDLLVASRGSRFGLPEAKVGQLGWYGIHKLQRAIPRQAIAELALTGASVSAERMWELGLLTRLVDPGESLSVALGLAEVISCNAPLSVTASLALLDLAQVGLETAYLASAAEIAARVASSEDSAEGAAAFIERRQPRWAGR
ncbi:MAG: enoyl-CoA hydratase-related protein [Candidatus Nanopelagicales bacterium]